MGTVATASSRVYRPIIALIRWVRYIMSIGAHPGRKSWVGLTAKRERRCRPSLEMLEDRCLLSTTFTQINLDSDVPGLARVTDPNLVNPWGISYSPTGAFWFGDNGTGVSDIVDGTG